MYRCTYGWMFYFVQVFCAVYNSCPDGAMSFAHGRVLNMVCGREGAIYRLCTGGCYIWFVLGRVLYMVCARAGVCYIYIYMYLFHI